MRRLSDRFSLGRCIGRGGVGEVYQGWQVSLDRPVAIKLLRPELTRHPRAVARFEREARTTCLLAHPNVVTVFDVGVSEEGAHFVVMELLEGETLADAMERSGPLPVERSLEIARQVARGMGAGQGVGLVHRDLKPENIFLLAGDHVKVLDFGLATLLEGREEVPAEEPESGPFPEVPPAAEPTPHWGGEEEVPSGATAAAPRGDLLVSARRLRARVYQEDRLTRPGALMGTPRYMAPEQALSWGVDHRTDLYSFGVIFFEMLAGRTPFLGPGSRDLLHQQIHEAPPRLHALAPHVPTAVCDIVDRLLAKSPSERFQDWSELQAALRRVEPALEGQERPAQITRAEEAAPTEPFRFLHPFTAAFRSIFFGRDGDLQRFSEAWRHPNRYPVLILTGASGVGKTSFMAAKVVPSLEDTGCEVLRVRGTARPFEALSLITRRRLSELGEPGGAEDSLGAMLESLVDSHRAAVALVLDQLEEVFTEGSNADAHALQANLAAIISLGDPRIRVVLSLREDYLGALLRALHPLPMSELSRTLPLRPLEAPDLKAALEGPGQAALALAYPPFRFEEGLAEEIVADLLADRQGEVAPRVQAVGARLWEMVRSEPEPHVITRAHYRDRLGGAHGILARVLDEAVAGLPRDDQGVAKEMLRALTHLPGSATGRPTPVSELTAHAPDPDRRIAVLRQMEDGWRVVHGFQDERWPGERTYRVAHEALISRIQEYGEEGAARNRARQLFHQGFSLWLAAGRQDDDLIPEQHFEEVLRCVGDLVFRSSDERTFYERSLRRHNEAWMKRHLEEKRKIFARRAQLALLPTVVLTLGFLLGQAVAGFPSLGRGWAFLVSNLKITGARMANLDLSRLELGTRWYVGANFRDSDLREAQLQGANLTATDWRGARMERSRLDGANLQQARLEGATLDEATLRGANLTNTIFSSEAGDARLDEADFTGAWYTPGTRFPQDKPPKGALGPRAELDDVILLDVSPPGRFPCDLRQAQAERLRVVGGDLSRCVLDGADLEGAVFRGVSMEEIRLYGANLKGASLRGAHLERGRLAEANLSGADLQDANLKDADLLAADLTGADLCGADLTGANLSHARTKGMKTCETTRGLDAD